MPSSGPGFTAAEKAAMKERAAELRAEGKSAKSAEKAAEKAAAAEKEMLGKIAELQGLDRELAEAVHEIVGEVAPGLQARTWYGMPAWTRDGKVVCFVKPAGKFDDRYATLGFESAAQLDDGSMWPTSYAVVGLTAAVRQQISQLVRTAAG